MFDAIVVGARCAGAPTAMLQVLAYLYFEQLVEDALQQLGDVAIVPKEALQCLLVQRNLVVGHGCPL